MLITTYSAFKSWDDSDNNHDDKAGIKLILSYM